MSNLYDDGTIRFTRYGGLTHTEYIKAVIDEDDRFQTSQKLLDAIKAKRVVHTSSITQDMLPDGFKLIRSFSLTYSFHPEGAWIVNDDVFDEYGIGKSDDEATKDYITQLLLYYSELKSNAILSNPASIRQFNELKSYIVNKSDTDA